MPLRGKIMNTWAVASDELLNSEEIRNTATVLGIKAGQNDIKGLRYAKVCILADADSDGLHIAVLLATLFKKHFSALVDAGHLYIALPPLFRIDVGKTVYYVADEKERDAYLKKVPEKQIKSVKITRFKGLGEMNPQQLKESVMEVETRRLLQITCTSHDDTETIMDMLLAKKRASDRREWLENKGNLASDLR